MLPGLNQDGTIDFAFWFVFTLLFVAFWSTLAFFIYLSKKIKRFLFIKEKEREFNWIRNQIRGNH